MLKNKNITIIKNPIQINHSMYFQIPKKKCIVDKDKTYVVKMEISEVDL